MVPSRPDSSQNGGAKKKGQESRLVERIDKLMQQLEESRKREERQREEIERQRKESEEKIERLMQRLLGKAAN